MDAEVVLSVQDAGTGFKPEEIDRLFEAFYTTKPEGVGMGLGISRSIIEAHGGRLWAEPNQGPGADLLIQPAGCRQCRMMTEAEPSYSSLMTIRQFVVPRASSSLSRIGGPDVYVRQGISKAPAT